MKTNAINPKKLLIVFVLAFLMVGLLPLSAIYSFAADEDNIKVEYKYTEGETLDIPPSMTQFGQEYKLISTSDPVLENSLPNMRTYNFKINGALTEEELKQLGDLSDLTTTPVFLEKEREVEFEEIITQDTNDIDEVPLHRNYTVSMADTIAGTTGSTEATLTRSGVEFDDTLTKYDAWGLPTEYTARVIYRGVETYAELGYYMGEATYQTEKNEGSTNTYIVVATYEPLTTDAGTTVTRTTTELPPVVNTTPPTENALPPVTNTLPPTQTTGDPIVVPAPATTTETPAPVQAEPIATPPSEFTEEEQRLLDAQVPLSFGNPLAPIKNITDGLTPLGSGGITGAWSVLSMLFSLIAFVIGIIMIVSIIVARQEKLSISEDESEVLKLKKAILKIMTLVFSILTIITWLMLDDLTRPQVWMNRWTPFVGIVLIVNIALLVMYNIYKNKKSSEEDEELSSDPVAVN